MTTTSRYFMMGFFDGLGETATVTSSATAAAGDFAVANMKDSRLFHRFRTATLSAVQLNSDFGSAQRVNMAAVIGTNLTLNATAQFQLADDSGISSNVVQSGAALAAAFDNSLAPLIAYVPPWGRTLLYIYPQDQSKRYSRITVTDAGNPAGYLEFAILRHGFAWQPGAQGNFDETWTSTDKLVGSPGSELVQRGHSLTFKNLVKVDAYNIAATARSMLSTRRVLVVPEPNSPERWLHDVIWCVLESVYERKMTMLAADATNPVYTVTLNFREATE